MINQYKRAEAELFSDKKNNQFQQEIDSQKSTIRIKDDTINQLRKKLHELDDELKLKDAKNKDYQNKIQSYEHKIYDLMSQIDNKASMPGK